MPDRHNPIVACLDLLSSHWLIVMTWCVLVLSWFEMRLGRHGQSTDHEHAMPGSTTKNFLDTNDDDYDSSLEEEIAGKMVVVNPSFCSTPVTEREPCVKNRKRKENRSKTASQQE